MTATASDIERTGTPPDWLVAVVNPVLCVILRSPLHWLVSDRLMVLSVTGRRTGTEYTFPVHYERDGGRLYVGSGETNWWKNLRDGGQEVTVNLLGRRRSGHAEVLEDDREVASFVHGYLERHGTDAAARVGLSIPGEAVPPVEVLESVLDHLVVVSINLSDV